MGAFGWLLNLGFSGGGDVISGTAAVVQGDASVAVTGSITVSGTVSVTAGTATVSASGESEGVALTNMGARARDWQALAGQARGVTADIIAGCIADEPSVNLTTVDGVLYQWLGLKGHTQKTLAGRKSSYAQSRGYYNWDSMDDLVP